MNIQNKKSSALLPLILALVLIIGILIGIKLNQDERTRLSLAKGDKLNTVLNLIQEQYVDPVSKDSLTEKAINAILESLDPHSVYIPAKDLEAMNEPLEGNFSGIGVQFNMQSDTVAVIMTVPNGPSAKLGILPGDRIVKINGLRVAGVKMSSDKIMKLLKGPQGTKVKVSIKRKRVSHLIDFVITRDLIPLYSVDASFMVTKNTGYMKINKFARTTHQEFVTAMNQLHKQGCNRLILDLRENGGGFLDAATSIADEFLKNKKLIVYTQGKSSPRTNIYATSRGICENDKLVILLDEWSASASEILAGAIQDNDRGIIIGRRSFGKGLVQEQTTLPDGSAIRLTVARYYTPTGRCIQKPYGNGTEDYYNDLNKRYAHGEFEVSDSIHFSKAKKYKTPKGRIVYGGGGIMPDVFVPLDTVGYTSFLGKVRDMGIIYKFAFDYTDQNRNKLLPYKNARTLNNYLEKQNLLPKFMAYAAKNGVRKKDGDLKKSEYLLKTELNAYIARNILDNEGFYPIIMNIDNTLQKAIRVIAKEK